MVVTVVVSVVAMVVVGLPVVVAVTIVVVGLSVVTVVVDKH